ncbi:hypothetical protein L0Y65_04760 [Candidatus Micrarchaeota archaeon]|nr:hypothetical protein [Candidatus Micrarchaeota archaeon]
MAVPQRFLGKKLLAEDEFDLAAMKPQDAFSNIRTFPLDYTVGLGSGLLSCPPKVAQELRALGYDQRAAAGLLLAVKMLKDKTGRDIDALVFAKLQKRYKVKPSVLAALASLCRQEAADLGITLRSIVRFYRRSHKAESDLHDIESFLAWAVSRGESVRGVPTAYKEYRARLMRK